MMRNNYNNYYHKQNDYLSFQEKLAVPSKMIGNVMRIPRTVYLVVFILCIGIIITLLNVLQLRAMQKEHFDKGHSIPTVEAQLNAGQKKQPVAWVRAKNPDGGYLDHVFNVLYRLGYKRGYDKESSWDLLWNHDYPFLDEELRPILLNLLPYQKVNHIPGSGFYTSKVNLATSNITGIPPAFSLPKEKEIFLKFANAHPDKFWVQKSNKHRGIRIKKINDLDLNAENSFIQEYIAKPLLIDKRKFDIGIYTVVTSLLPLRVYIYEGDVLLRFCPKDYHPFDPEIVDKYVVGDDYTPTWEMPSLRKYYTDLGFPFKETLNAYLRSKGKDPSLIWQRIDDTVRQVFMAKIDEMQPLLSKYKYSWNFFELSRFDFVLDEDLNVYLMEANMSPNLSSGHFVQNKLLYEQVIFNLFSVVGVARQIHSESLEIKSKDELDMIASQKDVQVFANQCAECIGCKTEMCQLCHHCISDGFTFQLREAYHEHLNRYSMRRVVPEPLISAGSAMATDDATFSRRLDATNTKTNEDKLMAWWFRGKCQQDHTWCS